MCGIFGEIRTKGGSSPSIISSATESMRSRGPDAAGYFVQGSLAFGHRRLSILDLAPSSQQPMIDNQLGLGLVFNGCIYNFQELRAALLGKGYRFFSQGDTEVILKAYHCWGPGCVRRFKGMFAFAVWERDTGRVVIARDRLGIKPLYYCEGDGFFRFASTLPALLAAGGVDTSLDPVGLHHYFSFHAAVPPPRTIINGVKKLAPATLLTIEPDGTRQSERYWNLSVGKQSAPRMTEADWIEAVAENLRAAIDRRRVSDVPVGVLLSGGVDSSLIVAMLAEMHHDDIRTFSIGFESAGDLTGDEFYYSNIIAKQFNTNHEQIRIPGSRILQAIPDAIMAMSEPMVSHDCVAFYLLSQEVAKRVKVVQSGQGADEVFGGYSWYPPFLTGNDAADLYEKAYFDWAHADIARLLTPDLITKDFSREFVREFFAQTPAATAADKALQIDTEVMLVDDPVKRVDNMTMASGLEARVPFLDHELVELASRIPASLKIGHGGKYILKQAARNFLPAEVIDRPKGYFPVPTLRHLEGPFLDYVRGILTSSKAVARGLYNSEFSEYMLNAPESEMSPKGHSRLWQAALLEGWMQAHAI